ncbi:MAG: hypothetical protein FD123_2376 [Bacteroidetes bacterium]|nr:MAG: hypothetical protein FD123_2376 [Bacteroidota bacterium]
MKKTSIFAAVAASVMILYSCSNQPAAVKPSQSAAAVPVGDHGTTVRVPLDTARKNIYRYDTLSQAIFAKFPHHVPIRAYTIHAGDMLEALGMPAADSAICQYKHARVYIGLDYNYSFKLYFTPVDSASLGGDNPVAGVDVILQDSLGKSYVLDLNAPCPNTCDVNSPLYRAGKK